MKQLVIGAVLAWTWVAGAAAADLRPSIAEPAPAPAPMVSDPLIDELRLGGFIHDPQSPEKGSVDINAEILFGKPFRSVEWWDVFLPRPHIGATVNTAGKTSTLYAGLTWQVDVTERFFLEASFGGSVNNGQNRNLHDDMNALGCHALFRESASAGYKLSEHWRIVATIEHNSNAGLCSENRGLTNGGVRIGYKF